MKIFFSMKTPDIADTVAKDVDKFESLGEEDRLRVQARLVSWFRYGEYLDLEFDTDTGDISVVRPR